MKSGSLNRGRSIALCTLLWFLAVPAHADSVLFTATVDSSGMAYPASVPAIIPAGPIYPSIPDIDPGVTLTPNPAFLDGNVTGPLNGVTYGPFGFGGNSGGNTGWVHVQFTVQSSGRYAIVWEVAGPSSLKVGSALAVDSIQVNGNSLFDFDSGLPSGFSGLGSVGTSTALSVTDAIGNPLPDFSPTSGTNFAYLDLLGNVTPIFDANAATDTFVGSRLYSSVFMLNTGDELSLDMAFLTNDGAPFFDYGIAALVQVPEPSSGMLLSVGCLLLAGTSAILRRSASG